MKWKNIEIELKEVFNLVYQIWKKKKNKNNIIRVKTHFVKTIWNRYKKRWSQRLLNQAKKMRNLLGTLE